MKSSFAPLQLVKDGASAMFSNNSNGIVHQGISTVVGFIMKNLFLRKAGFITRLIVPFIAKNTANNLIADNKTQILGWIGNLILKAGSKKSQNHVYDKTTADTNV